MPYMSLLEATIRERRGSGRIGTYLRSTCGTVNLLRVVINYKNIKLDGNE